MEQIKCIQKSNRIIVKGIDSSNIVIPSRMYPLESADYKIFTEHNTSRIVDSNMIDIINKMQVERGRCFTNSEKLLNALLAFGYDAKQYVGWLFVEDMQPIHHSFVVLNQHVLDLSLDFTGSEIEKIKEKDNIHTNKELRQAILKELLELELKPNSERFVIGKCKKDTFYIAAEGSKEEGMDRNLKLRKEYPNHPAFRDVNNNGNTKMLEMYHFAKKGM